MVFFLPAWFGGHLHSHQQLKTQRVQLNVKSVFAKPSLFQIQQMCHVHRLCVLSASVEANDPFHRPLIINAVEEKRVPSFRAEQQSVTEVIAGSYRRKFITSPGILHYPLDLPHYLYRHSIFACSRDYSH